MELVVYIAIMGIIVIVAGQAFSNSTKFRVRNQSMIEANEITENIASLIKDDIAQMGAKSAVDPTKSTSNGDAFQLVSEVYMDPDNAEEAEKDLSSYNLTTRAAGDSLTFRRTQYLATGAYNRVEEISWYVHGDTLYRSCQAIAGNPDTTSCPQGEPLEVEMATGVSKFVVSPTRIDSSEILFPDRSSDATNENFKFISRVGGDNYVYTNASPSGGGFAVSLSGFTTNYDGTGVAPANPRRHQVFVDEADGANHTWNQCKKIKFKKDSIYTVSFTMVSSQDESRMFRANVDHFSLGIRKVDGEEVATIDDVPDFYFYPPQSDKGQNGRTMQFSSKNNDFEACLVFTFAFYSPTVNMGNLVISDLKVTHVVEMATVSNMSDKKNVRIFNVDLVIKRNGEAGAASISIPVPSNGV